VRDAMIAFSRGDTNELLRSIIPLSDGRMFGIMPGSIRDSLKESETANHWLPVGFAAESKSVE
jgi:hypothetical protein